MRRLFFCIALLASAQSKPNFSGAWHLNLDASDYSSPLASRPDRMTLTVQQKGDRFKYKLEREKDGKKGSFDVDVTVGGAPFESDAAGVVSMEWKGAALAVHTLYNPGQDRQSDQEEIWTLSTDGRRLTDEVTTHPPQQRPAGHVVRVFDKQ